MSSTGNSGAGSAATDTIYDAAGDIVVGTGADTAARVAITVPAANILEVLGVVNGETTASWKPVHDGTAPSTQAFGDSAAAGTALTAAHRDHKHAMPAAPTTIANDTLWAAKGDLAIATGNDAAAILGVGSNGQSIVADSAATSGQIWTQTERPVNIHGLLGMTMDGTDATTSFQPVGATIYLTKLAIPYSFTITNLIVNVTVAGTSYSNAQVGVYSSAGTYLSASAVLASAGTNTFGAVGDKIIPLGAAQAITGGATVFVWVALHIGVNSATAVKVGGLTAAGAGGAAAAGPANFGLAAATAYAATQTGSAASTLATVGNLTPASNVLAATSILIGVT